MVEMMRGGMAVENVRIFRGALYISEDGERARKESQGQRCRARETLGGPWWHIKGRRKERRASVQTSTKSHPHESATKCL